MAKLTPFKEALGKLAWRLPVGADLSSSEWADVPLALRERALFSARVTNAGYVQDIMDRVGKILNPVTVERDGRQVTEGMDFATARAELKQILKAAGYNPGDKAGGIEDLSSDRRIELQLRQNSESAQGFGNFLQGQAPGALDAFPAQELFRAEERKDPRNWPTRWMQAGGQIFGGRMIALKSDAVWSAISAFGTPYPSFDYGSGMWVRDVDRAEAESLGLIAPGEVAQPVVEDFNAKLQASVTNIAPELQQSLQRSFGDQIVIQDGTARWRAAA
jgi:hypothetical protein